MGKVRQRGSGSVGGVVPGGPPAASLIDPVAERRRDALMLLRRKSVPVACVVQWAIADNAILWLDQLKRPRTTFVTEVDGKPELSPPYHGFIV